MTPGLASRTLDSTSRCDDSDRDRVGDHGKCSKPRALWLEAQIVRRRTAILWVSVLDAVKTKVLWAFLRQYPSISVVRCLLATCPLTTQTRVM